MFRSGKSGIKAKDIDALKWLTAISFVILGTAYCLPMFFAEGIPAVDDTTFHLGRLVGLSNVWSSPVNFDSFGNNGLMVNIFYPWLTMYPMWILYKVTGSYVLAYKLYYTVLTIATLFIAYCSIHGIAKSRMGAYVFALAYAFSSYRFADIYNRGALGEAIALTFLPLVLLGVYKIGAEDFRDWRKLAAGMTLIAYSHILSLLMAAVFAGILFLLTFVAQDNKKERIASFVKAACLSAILSAGMIVPMLEQYLKNNLYSPSGSGEVMADSADTLVTILQYSLQNNPLGRGIGLISLVAFAASGTIIIYKIVGDRKRMGLKDEFAACLFLIGLIIAVCASNLLPWRFLGDNTPISTLQFVWRLNAYTTIAFAAAFSILVSDAMNSTHKSAIIVVLVVVGLSGFQFYTMYTQNEELISEKRIMEADIANWSSGNVDYTPIQASEYKEERGKSMDYIFINGDKVKKSPTISRGGSLYKQDIGGSDEDRIVDIPVFKFSDESVLLNGKPVESVISVRGTTELTVPKSENAVIEINYNYSLAARVAWIVSGITLLFTIANSAQKGRKEE